MAIAAYSTAFGSGGSQKASPKPESYENLKNYVRNPTQTTASDRGNTPKSPTKTYEPKGGSSDSGGGGGGDYTPVSSSQDYESRILDTIKDLLTQQKNQADEYYKTLYNQRYNQINQESDANRDRINTNFKRGERYLQSLYGNSDTGTNWSNRARNYQNWQSNLAANRLNRQNLIDSAASQRDMGLANNASTLAQGWYNYVMPVMTNRQNYSDSLVNQQNLNAMDLDYRKYLASL